MDEPVTWPYARTVAFLYGDSTAAPFDENFLESLRDAIDFAAAVAESDERIVTADARKLSCSQAADAEAMRLEGLALAMIGAASAAEKGGSATPTSALASELTAIVSERHRGASFAVTAKLTEDIRAIDVSAINAQSRYRAALEVYLLLREPPFAATQLTLTLTAGEKKADDRYDATTTGWSDLGLVWAIERGLPDDGLWSKSVRVDKVIADGLSIQAPQKSGLIKKEVKVKKQKLDRHLVTKLVDDGALVLIELRAELGGETGFDLSVHLEKRVVTAVRIGPANDLAVGPFDVDPADIEALCGFAEKLRETSLALPRKRLVLATLDGAPFDGAAHEHQPTLVEIVPRLDAKLAPIVAEIAARSRAEDELVLRRSLRDGHREEIFLPKSTLREKLASLGAAHRALFAPLTLDAPAPTAGPFSANEPPTFPTVRSKVASSIPAPAGGQSRPALLVKRAALAPKARPAQAEAEPAAPAEPAPPEAAQVVATQPEAPPVEPPQSHGESHAEHAALFASAAFATRSVDDRREALRQMIFAEPPPARSEEMRSAHNAAVAALQLLVVEHRDPADYEMLGMAYGAIGESGQAIEIWKKALELERARNPASELCARLVGRVGER